MPRTIAFRNHGEIDPRGITTFGISAKDTDNPIGFFGTGLKYAIAILLREGCEIDIYTGCSLLQFDTAAQQFRSEEFRIVRMNGNPIGFTTELGKTWELWQAFRELYCNCMDENGEVYEVEGGVRPDNGETLILVRGNNFAEVWDNRDTVVLSTTPIERTPIADIHPGASAHVYYKGIRIYDLRQRSQYTYNIKGSMDLTEDRTARWSFEIPARITRAVQQSKSEEVARSVLTAPREAFESKLLFDASHASSDTFRKTAITLAKSFDRTMNSSAVQMVRQWGLDRLHEAEYKNLTAIDKARLDKAQAFCAEIGFAISDYPIVVTDFLGESVLGMAQNNTIYISDRALMMGTKMLAGTLIEEFLHLRHKVEDETRDMQNFLMDTIVSLGERITGEPL